jgi:hypothetical protein
MRAVAWVSVSSSGARSAGRPGRSQSLTGAGLLPQGGQSASAAGATMPFTVRLSMKSPMAVISHSPEN